MTQLRLTLLIPFAVALGCAGATSDPASPEPASSTRAAPAAPAASASAQPAAEEEPVVCDMWCERAKILEQDRLNPDHISADDAAVNAVLDAMKDDLLACYQTRLKAVPTAHGFITVRIVIAPNGAVKDVTTKGGAVLGEGTMDCIVARIKKAQFDPPRGGGTLTVEAPFGLRKVAPGDDTL